ncbi:MAG: carbon-nitrogen hydrolase family protein [Bacilli bacterium]
MEEAEVILYPSNNMHPFAQYHRIYSIARAMENAVFVVYCNRTGSELDVEFCGASGVAHPTGDWIDAAAQDSDLLFFELNLKDRSTLHASLNYHVHRKLILIMVAGIAMLVSNAGHLSFEMFNPLRVKNGLSGIGLAFPLAVFLFIGVGNPAPMVEEVRNPRKSVPLAIFTSTIFVTVIYLFMAWATTIAFHSNIAQII